MRNMNRIFSTMVLLACSTVALAQSNKPLQQRTISEALDTWITNAESHITAVADAMPEEKYSFAPDIAMGEFNGVRTFAQQVKHLAANNYWMAALILGDQPNAEMYNETGPDSVKTKAEVMGYLKGSFVALHKAIATIDQKNVVEQMKSPSDWQKTRLSFAIDAVAHTFDHYGQLVEYLRMNGIIPPDSRRRQR
jgi:hypothetical protein